MVFETPNNFGAYHFGKKRANILVFKHPKLVFQASLLLFKALKLFVKWKIGLCCLENHFFLLFNSLLKKVDEVF